MTLTGRADTAPAHVRFNPFASAFRRNPYPDYERLRTLSPVHRTLGMWVLTRHSDVRHVLRDSMFSAALIPELVSAHTARYGREDPVAVRRTGTTSLVFTDDPEHARLRGLANQIFSTRAISSLHEHVRVTAETLLRNAVHTCASVDVIADYAAHLPITVICEWMNLPASMRPDIGRWTHDIRFLLEPTLMTAADLDRVHAVVDAFTVALQHVIDARRDHPGTDLISRMLTATTASDELSVDEIVVLCIMCFVAGNETTTALIGNTSLALLSRPDLVTALRTGTLPVRALIDESVRYESPLQMTKRVATADTEIDGHVVHAGDQLLLCLGAANRDPDVFDRPDDFDPARTGAKHVGFGHGMHRCLGALLAHMQAEIAVETLFTQYDPRRIDAAALQWQTRSSIVRGLAHLPVTL
ncbi:cytochrome P450 [Rhodococcus sp. G-MC3]|uniref:cytochrome P450 n=1 Tax=Rhodococcus sp. G-MC3 TaxID=3046209 RepID=UPI0024BBA036|nr:cytochrome P450 [Rhodococcus sp. G-MC3]MDJ0394187.1 cytochrome P450 [Rhodococcus sp. G-MC3]